MKAEWKIILRNLVFSPYPQKGGCFPHTFPHKERLFCTRIITKLVEGFLQLFQISPKPTTITTSIYIRKY